VFGQYQANTPSINAHNSSDDVIVVSRIDYTVWWRNKLNYIPLCRIDFFPAGVLTNPAFRPCRRSIHGKRIDKLWLMRCELLQKGARAGKRTKGSSGQLSYRNTDKNQRKRFSKKSAFIILSLFSRIFFLSNMLRHTNI